MNPPIIRYTALGDSISFGIGASFFQGYVSMLGSTLKGFYPGTSVRNISKILAVSENLLCQIKYKPVTRSLVASSNLLTISIGGNNLLRAAKNKYTVFNEEVASQGVYRLMNEWPLILQEIRNELKNPCPIYVMTIYNPCRPDDPRYPVFNEYILQVNSILANEELIYHFGYHIVDVYSHFETNPSKNWTHLYDERRNIHPNDEGHKQIYLLHRTIMEI